jgi:hypothetical protein
MSEGLNQGNAKVSLLSAYGADIVVTSG